MMHTSFIKTSVLGLTVAASSLFAEVTYAPHKYQQNDWFAEFGGGPRIWDVPAVSFFGFAGALILSIWLIIDIWRKK